jgi:hypothetical protein
MAKKFSFVGRGTAMRHACRSKTSGLKSGLLWLLTMVVLFGCVASRTRLIAQKSQPTEKDVLQIVERCFLCHGEARQMASLDLRTRAGMLEGGNSGPAIVPGHADDSLLIKRVSGLVKPQMPMSPVPALKAEEIAVLKDWIDQGAKASGDDNTLSKEGPPGSAPNGSQHARGVQRVQGTSDSGSGSPVVVLPPASTDPGASRQRSPLESESDRCVRQESHGGEGSGTRAAGG